MSGFEGLGVWWGFGWPLITVAWCQGVPEAVCRHWVCVADVIRCGALPLSVEGEGLPQSWASTPCAGALVESGRCCCVGGSVALPA